MFKSSVAVGGLFSTRERNVSVLLRPSLCSASIVQTNQPSIISSQVCSPHRTVLLGSGLAGLPSELSNRATHFKTEPAGTFFASLNQYMFCQLKS